MDSRSVCPLYVLLFDDEPGEKETHNIVNNIVKAWKKHMKRQALVASEDDNVKDCTLSVTNDRKGEHIGLYCDDVDVIGIPGKKMLKNLKPW